MGYETDFAIPLTEPLDSQIYLQGVTLAGPVFLCTFLGTTE